MDTLKWIQFVLTFQTLPELDTVSKEISLRFSYHSMSSVTYSIVIGLKEVFVTPSDDFDRNRKPCSHSRDQFLDLFTFASHNFTVSSSTSNEEGVTEGVTYIGR